MRLMFCTAAALVFTGAVPVSAADWIVGLGTTDFSRDGASDEAALVIEVHGPTLGRIGRFDLGFGGALEVDSEGDYWVGAGVAALGSIGNGPWFVEASLMPGFYDEAIQENDLGGNLQFRSLLGLGYAFANGARISLAASHKSNGGFEDENPGANAISVRYRRGF